MHYFTYENRNAYNFWIVCPIIIKFDKWSHADQKMCLMKNQLEYKSKMAAGRLFGLSWIGILP